MTTLTTGATPNESPNETEIPATAHSPIFFHTTTGQFEVLQWPPLGASFHGKGGRLVPYGGFVATYESRGVRWTVGTFVGEDETLLYQMKGVKQDSGGSPVEIQGKKASAVLKKVYEELSIRGASNTSAPAAFCLRGENREDQVPIQDIFATIQQGKRRSSTPSTGSDKALRHAKDNCCGYIDRLPANRRLPLVHLLLQKYGSSTATKQIAQVELASSLEKFCCLKETKHQCLPYSHALQTVMTASFMGGIEENALATALGIRLRGQRFKKASERALVNDTTTTETTETNETTIKPQDHKFYGKRNPRQDSHEETGLAAEYRAAFVHDDVAQVQYTGKKQTEPIYELKCPQIAVWINYIERKRLINLDFNVSWSRFKKERPKNVKDSKNKSCLCPHHLQHQCFVSAIHEHRKLTHRPKQLGWGSNNASGTCDCELAENCPGAKCTSIHRDVTYGMLCSVRGMPSGHVRPVDRQAYERVLDLPKRGCYCTDGNGELCADCWSDDSLELPNPTARTTEQIPESDLEMYEAKIKRSIGECPLEEEEGDDYDIDVTNRVKVTETKAKGSTKGATKYAFVPETVSVATFWASWILYTPIFLMHAFTSSWQGRQLSGDNGIIREEGGHRATVSIDYSENWTHTVHFEHQSAYWSRSNTTLVPVIVCFDTRDVKPQLWEKMQIERDAYERERKEAMLPLKIQIAIGFISEDKLHDKAMSQHIMDDTISWILKFTNCEKIITLSDGCRAQFKSRHMAGWMASIPRRFGIAFEWHFHCSCHGKCLCDSVGGTWKHLAENAVSGQSKSFSKAKDLYDFLKARIDAGQTKWKIRKIKSAAKAAAYGMRLQDEEVNWIPRPGEPGCVLRGSVDLYLPMPGITSWHRFVAVNDGTDVGKLYVSDHSCFCGACKEGNWDCCPFIADTGEMIEIKPQVDVKKSKKEKWTAEKSMDLARDLENNDWVVWHVANTTDANRNLFGENNYAFGKFVSGQEGTTTLTEEGTMAKIIPYRTSQLDGLSFHPQIGTTFMVDVQELLCCGLQIKLKLLNRKDKFYADKYYAPGDDRNGSIVTLRQTTIDHVLKKLDRWGKPKKKTQSKGKKKARKDGAASSSSSSNGNGGGASVGVDGSMSDGEDQDVGEVRPTVEEYKCGDCGATSFTQRLIWFKSHVHDKNCDKYRKQSSSSSSSSGSSTTSRKRNR